MKKTIVTFLLAVAFGAVLLPPDAPSRTTLRSVRGIHLKVLKAALSGA
jgi:hypothetical protein